MWPDDNWKFKYGTWQKLTAGTYTYTIRFYVGNEKTSSGTSYSVSEFKDTDGTSLGLTDDSASSFKLDGNVVNMSQYADAVVREIDQYTLLLSSYGITLNPSSEKYSTFTGTVSQYSTNEDYKCNIVFVNPNAYLGAYGKKPLSNGGKYIHSFSGLYVYSTVQNGETDYVDGGTGFKNKYYNIRNVVLHEITHNLGLTHQWYFSDGSSSNKRVSNLYFGNPNTRSMPFHRGFIHKGWVTEDTLNGLDIIYNNSTVCKISGTISATNNTESKQVLAALKDKFSFVYLIDSYKKEFMYQSIIDEDGYYEFRLRILPPSSIDYYILAVSSEFDYNFIQKIYQEDGTWDNVLTPAYRNLETNTFDYTMDDSDGSRALSKNGYIYFILSKIGALSAGNTTKNLTIDTSVNYKVESLELLEEEINNNVIYIETDPQYSTVKGNNDKYYTAKKTHTAKTGNRPVSGDNYKKYWRKATVKERENATNWARGTKYYAKSKKQQSLSMFEQMAATIL